MAARLGASLLVGRGVSLLRSGIRCDPGSGDTNDKPREQVHVVLPLGMAEAKNGRGAKLNASTSVALHKAGKGAKLCEENAMAPANERRDSATRNQAS